MKPLTHFKNIRILRNIFLSLGAIFALGISAHAQNAQYLYVSANRPASFGGHAILEFTPSGGVPSVYASISEPRGLAFDSTFSNLFAAEILVPAKFHLGRVLKFNQTNHVSTVGSAAYFVFNGLATDIAGNAYVLATDVDPVTTAAGTIFKFTPSGERIVFGSVPGAPNPQVANLGLAFDNARYYLYATATNAQTIFKFAPDGTRTVFAGPDQFAEGEYLGGLAFDSSGNLFVSIVTFTGPGNDSVVYFDTNGLRHHFAPGLTNPRGLAFDSSDNLFVAEANTPFDIPPGDILKFHHDGSPYPVFATGFGRPEFLTFGPPR